MSTQCVQRTHLCSARSADRNMAQRNHVVLRSVHAAVALELASTAPLQWSYTDFAEATSDTSSSMHRRCSILTEHAPAVLHCLLNKQ
jgi:hypothetical protein